MEGAREQGRETSREVSCGGHWPVYNIFTNHPTTRPLPLIDTLLLQMKNSEQVYIINYVYCLPGV